MPKVPIIKVASGQTAMTGLTLGTQSPLTKNIPSLNTANSLPHFQQLPKMQSVQGLNQRPMQNITKVSTLSSRDLGLATLPKMQNIYGH